ncbi:MAG: ThuA domain-containing protein [Opitutus sp.]|nr:ThuA domain-containing protein [Opitutus sp.]
MPLPLRLVGSFVSLVLALGSVSRAAETAEVTPKKLLVFTKSSGYQHDAVKLEGPPGHGFAFPVLRKLGAKNKIEFTFSKDGTLFSPEYLAQFDGFVFYTTQDLTEAKTEAVGDGLPPMTAAGKAALLQAVKDGKGFVGVHSASNTFQAPGTAVYGPARHRSDGDKADPFIKMLGGEFINHGAQQAGRLSVADTKFPGMSAVPADFGMYDEWYSLKNFAPDLHVLLVQNTARMEGEIYARPPYPSTWVRMEGKGRVFYTSMGHREDVWKHPTFQSILEGGLNWSLCRLEADVAPNLATAAPRANELPKYVEPAAKKAEKKK